MCESKWNLFLPNAAVMVISSSLVAPFSRLPIFVSSPLSSFMTQHSTEHTEQGRCGRRLAFEIKCGIWNNLAFWSLLSLPAVSEPSPAAHNAILWFLWKSGLGKFKTFIVYSHWHSFFSCVYALITTPKMSANENRSQVKNKAASCFWMGKFPVLP